VLERAIQDGCIVQTVRLPRRLIDEIPRVAEASYTVSDVSQDGDVA
jgi:hypothetical protein